MIADSTVRSMCTIGQEISIWCEKEPYYKSGISRRTCCQ